MCTLSSVSSYDREAGDRRERGAAHARRPRRRASDRPASGRRAGAAGGPPEVETRRHEDQQGRPRDQLPLGEDAPEREPRQGVVVPGDDVEGGQGSRFRRICRPSRGGRGAHPDPSGHNDARGDSFDDDPGLTAPRTARPTEHGQRRHDRLAVQRADVLRGPVRVATSRSARSAPTLWAQETAQAQRPVRGGQHHGPGAVVGHLPARRLRRGARPGRAHGIGLPGRGWGLREWFVLTYLMGSFFIAGQATEYAALVQRGRHDPVARPTARSSTSPPASTVST